MVDSWNGTFVFKLTQESLSSILHHTKEVVVECQDRKGVLLWMMSGNMVSWWIVGMKLLISRRDDKYFITLHHTKESVAVLCQDRKGVLLMGDVLTHLS